MTPGQGIVRMLWIGTGLFAVAALLAAVTAVDSTELVALVIDLALFLLGCAAFLSAYVRAIARSRTEEIAVAGLYLLMGGTGSGAIRRSLLGGLAVEVVVALATAATRPYSPLAFGVLVPVYGLGLTGLWAARHGRFPARQPPVRGRRHGQSRTP
jgi:hypothetical protein